jgi:hypothetical protein
MARTDPSMSSDAEPSVQAGDLGQVVQLSLCVGGVIRTWLGSGETSLWRLVSAENVRRP